MFDKIRRVWAGLSCVAQKQRNTQDDMLGLGRMNDQTCCNRTNIIEDIPFRIYKKASGSFHVAGFAQSRPNLSGKRAGATRLQA